MSPRPGISTLITSAPIHASSCVPVGPAWTWLKSRTRTPSKALLIQRLDRDRLDHLALGLAHDEDGAVQHSGQPAFATQRRGFGGLPLGPCPDRPRASDAK